MSPNEVNEINRFFKIRSFNKEGTLAGSRLYRSPDNTYMCFLSGIGREQTGIVK